MNFRDTDDDHLIEVIVKNYWRIYTVFDPPSQTLCKLMKKHNKYFVIITNCVFYVWSSHPVLIGDRFFFPGNDDEIAFLTGGA